MDIEFSKDELKTLSGIQSLGLQIEDYNDVITTISTISTLSDLKNFYFLDYQELATNEHSTHFSLAIDQFHRLEAKFFHPNGGSQKIRVESVLYMD